MTLFTTSRAMALALAAAVSNCGAGEGFTKVTFERTPCFGTCPVYKVDVDGNGTVTFEGIRNVDSIGTYTGHIDAKAVAALRKAFEDAHYATLAPKYDHQSCPDYGTDAARILTSITTAEGTRSVDHDLGCGSQAPAQLGDLYRKFDDIVGTSRWIGQR